MNPIKADSLILWRWKKNAPCGYNEEVVSDVNGNMIKLNVGFDRETWLDIAELDIVIMKP